MPKPKAMMRSILQLIILWLCVGSSLGLNMTTSSAVGDDSLEDRELRGECVTYYYEVMYDIETQPQRYCDYGDRMKIARALEVASVEALTRWGMSHVRAKVCPASRWRRGLEEEQDLEGAAPVNGTDREALIATVADRLESEDKELFTSNLEMSKRDLQCSCNFYFGGGRCSFCPWDNRDHRSLRYRDTQFGNHVDFHKWKRTAQTKLKFTIKRYLMQASGLRKDRNHCFYKVSNVKVEGVFITQRSSWSSAVPRTC